MTTRCGMSGVAFRTAPPIGSFLAEELLHLFMTDKRMYRLCYSVVDWFIVIWWTSCFQHWCLDVSSFLRSILLPRCRGFTFGLTFCFWPCFAEFWRWSRDSTDSAPELGLWPPSIIVELWISFNWGYQYTFNSSEVSRLQQWNASAPVLVCLWVILMHQWNWQIPRLSDWRKGCCKRRFTPEFHFVSISNWCYLSRSMRQLS